MKTLYIEPGSPWENGYVRSSTPAARRAARSEQFSTLYEAKVLIESGGGTTMQSGHIPRSAIARLHPRSLFRRLLRGRLRNFNQLRRPRFCCTCDQT